MTDATIRPTVPIPGAGDRKPFTVRRAVLVGAAASVVFFAAALLILPERGASAPDSTSASSRLSLDSLPPPIDGRQRDARPIEILLPPVKAEAAPAAMLPVPSGHFRQDQAGLPSAPAVPAPPSPMVAQQASLAAPQLVKTAPAVPAAPAGPPSEGVKPPASPISLASTIAQAAPALQLLGGASVRPLDSDWAQVEGSLGCPSAATGSVMDLLCQFNAQTLAREYQLKLMEQNARRAEIAARLAQADATRADAQRRQRTGQPLDSLPPADQRSPAAVAVSGPTISAIRGQGGTWTAILRLADGSNATVKTGQELPGGLRVQRIDRDGVSVRGPGTAVERRLAFATMALPGADDASALPRLPTPRP